jgi:hypothetical protein
MKKLTKKALKELSKTTPKQFDSATVENRTQEYLAEMAGYILENGYPNLDKAEAVRNAAFECCPYNTDEVDAFLYWNASEAFQVLRDTSYPEVLIENRRNLAIETLETSFRELFE